MCTFASKTATNTLGVEVSGNNAPLFGMLCFNGLLWELQVVIDCFL